MFSETSAQAKCHGPTHGFSCARKCVALSGLNLTFLYHSRLKLFEPSTPNSARAIDGEPRRFTGVVLNACGVGAGGSGPGDLGGPPTFSRCQKAGAGLLLPNAGTTPVQEPSIRDSTF